MTCVFFDAKKKTTFPITKYFLYPIKLSVRELTDSAKFLIKKT